MVNTLHSPRYYWLLSRFWIVFRKRNVSIKRPMITTDPIFTPWLYWNNLDVILILYVCKMIFLFFFFLISRVNQKLISFCSKHSFVRLLKMSEKLYKLLHIISLHIYLYIFWFHRLKLKEIILKVSFSKELNLKNFKFLEFFISLNYLYHKLWYTLYIKS